MAFAFLLVLTGILFSRPGELLPILQSLHPYELAILTCMFLGFDRLVDTISARSLARDPILLCTVGLFSWMTLVEVIHVRLDPAYAAAETLIKLLIYFLILISFVDRPSQLRLVLLVVVISGVVNLTFAIINFHGYAQFEYMLVIEEVSYTSGEELWTRRLGSSTIFGDPNDLALFVSQCVIICLFFAWDGNGFILLRALWIIPAGYMVYAISLTQSRGGFVSLMAGVVAMIMSRLGRKSVLILAPILPVALAFFAGRQSNIDLGDGSGQARVRLWVGYLDLLWTHPLMGVGWELGPLFCSQQAHNSYLQAYGEQGFLAGTLFVGIVVLTLWTLTRPVSDPDWARIRPCLLGLVVAQTVGMMGLTRHLAVPTFTVIGMATVYFRSSGVAPLMPRGGKLIWFLLIASIGFLAFMWIVTQLNKQS